MTSFIIIMVFLVVIVAIIGGVLLYKKSRRDTNRSYGQLWHWEQPNSDQIGEQGERAVIRCLKRICTQKANGKMAVFNNYKIEENNRSHQIDHIVVNEHGVFVLETKNYKGIIAGDRNSREWTQTLAYGEIKNSFYNPIKQNETHVYALKAVLPPRTPIHSYVIFIDNDLRYIFEPEVITLGQLKQVLNQGNEFLTDDEIIKITEILQKNRSEISDEEHVKNIKETQWKIAHNICPRCGGELILRHGQYGYFYGCENYPKCKFKKKIDD